MDYVNLYATNIFSSIRTDAYSDSGLKGLIDWYISSYDIPDDYGIVSKDELKSKEYKRLYRFCEEQLRDRL